MNPMNKQAREELISMLRKHHTDIGFELDKNRIELAKLADKQAVAKRKRAEIHMMINLLRDE